MGSHKHCQDPPAQPATCSTCGAANREDPKGMNCSNGFHAPTEREWSAWELYLADTSTQQPVRCAHNPGPNARFCSACDAEKLPAPGTYPDADRTEQGAWELYLADCSAHKAPGYASADDLRNTATDTWRGYVAMYRRAEQLFKAKADERIARALEARDAELATARRVRDECRASYDKTMAMLKEAQAKRDGARDALVVQMAKAAEQNFAFDVLERLASEALSPAARAWLREKAAGK